MIYSNVGRNHLSFDFKQMIVETDFTKTHKLFYGEPGTGKTTFATVMKDSQGKPPFFIFTEKGNGETTPYGQVISSWAGFLKLRDILLGTHKEELIDKFGCIVLDVIGDLEDMSGKYVAEKAKVQNIADLAHGKGWVLHEEAIKDGLLPLMNLLPCVFIAHVKDKQILNNGELVTILTSNLGKRAFNFLNGKVDFIMYFQPPHKKSEHYEITMRAELGRVAKSRYPYMNRTFRNVKDQPEATWEAMCTCFRDKGIKDGTRNTAG